MVTAVPTVSNTSEGFSDHCAGFTQRKPDSISETASEIYPFPPIDPKSTPKTRNNWPTNKDLKDNVFHGCIAEPQLAQHVFPTRISWSVLAIYRVTALY